MSFHYFDNKHPLLPYIFSLPGELNEGEFLPDNAIFEEPEFINGYWPGANAEKNGWLQIEDHRQKTDKNGHIIEKTGTSYWLPGDTWQSPARYMTDIGPLPKEALLTPPEMDIKEKNRRRIEEIKVLLLEIDTKSARPLRSIYAKKGTVEDEKIIEKLEAEAEKLRYELEILESK